MTQSSMFDERGADLLAILMAPAEPEAPKPAPFVTRHYYRCCDCLTVAATVAKIAYGKDKWGYSNGKPGAVCDACGGAIEYMGETHRETLRNHTGYRAICDGKCISAHGPVCDCQCGGANHGSGMVVPIIETSSIPRLGIAGPKAKMAGELWRALIERYKAAWQERYGYVIGRKNGGAYLSGEEFSRFCAAGRTTSKFWAIRDGRTAARSKKLEALIVDMKTGKDL